MDEELLESFMSDYVGNEISGNKEEDLLYSINRSMLNLTVAFNQSLTKSRMDLIRRFNNKITPQAISSFIKDKHQLTLSYISNSEDLWNDIYIYLISKSSEEMIKKINDAIDKDITGEFYLKKYYLDEIKLFTDYQRYFSFVVSTYNSLLKIKNISEKDLINTADKIKSIDPKFTYDPSKMHKLHNHLWKSTKLTMGKKDFTIKQISNLYSKYHEIINNEAKSLKKEYKNTIDKIESTNTTLNNRYKNIDTRNEVEIVSRINSLTINVVMECIMRYHMACNHVLLKSKKNMDNTIREIFTDNISYIQSVMKDKRDKVGE